MQKFFADLNNVKRCMKGLIWILMAFALLMFMSAGNSIFALNIFVGLTILTIVVYGAIELLFWRCPYCGKHLGGMADCGSYCKHCGKELKIK